MDVTSNSSITITDVQADIQEVVKNIKKLRDAILAVTQEAYPFAEALRQAFISAGVSLAKAFQSALDDRSLEALRRDFQKQKRRRLYLRRYRRRGERMRRKS